MEQITSGLKFNYILKELAIKQIEAEQKGKKSIASYKEVLKELNIMHFE